MRLETFPVGPLACNCSILSDEESGEALVLDAGDEPERVAEYIETRGLRVRALLHTHAHIDHIGAAGALRERTGASALLHPADLPLYATLAEQARWIGLARAPQIISLDGELTDGQMFSLGKNTVTVLHTPGHTPGSVSFALENRTARRLFTGDTLFRGSIGRWDLGGTSQEDIVNSIREKLLVFPDNTPVVPGHGPATTIGDERRSNPFLQSLR